MADFPFPWCIYAEHQSRAARGSRLTDRSWGIENGLTSFLKAVESGSVPEDQAEFQGDIDRAVATGSWLERNHARLLRKYVRPQEEHSERRLLDRLRLAEMRESMKPAEWAFLMAVAAGIAYHEMAGMTAGAARTRLARLRSRLRSTAQQDRQKAPESRQI